MRETIVIRTITKEDTVRIDKYFDSAEVACKCGCGIMPTEDAIDALTALRKLYGKPITITSGARCKYHNNKVGGAENSRHYKNKDAFDVIIKGGMKDIPYFSYRAWQCGFRAIVPINAGAGNLHIDMQSDSNYWLY